jgi:hypothetical protein
MPGHYSISKRSDGWAVIVDGATVLICERKKAAIQAVQDAMAQEAAAAAGSADQDPCTEPEAANEPLAKAS